MKRIKKFLALILTVAMLMTFVPTAASAATTDSDSFMTIVSLDAGRKYFSVDNIKTIIDEMSAKGYNTLELILGNDGLRFLLDDMSVTVNGTAYTSERVTAAIQTGNKAYSDQTNYGASANELTQDEMVEIISYANGEGISVIPAINSPGHMDAILAAATALTGTDCSYNESERTIDVTNSTAVAFTKALITKYVEFFAEQGCTYFNMGADEYANDKTNGFSDLISNGNYSYFVDYVNQVAAIIKSYNMTPIAFNDGIYYNSNTSGGTFDTDIVIAYWTNGWSGYSPASAEFLANQGFKIINTNSNWYYVLGATGSTTGWGTWEHANQDTKSVDVTTVLGGCSTDALVGSMLAVWCDTPSVTYSDTEQTHVLTLIDNQAAANASYFTASSAAKSAGADTAVYTSEESVTVSAGGTKVVTTTGANNAGTYTTGDTSVATVKVTGSDATAATSSYNSASYVYPTSLAGSNTSWTKTSYYYKASDGEYYPVYAYKKSSTGGGYGGYGGGPGGGGSSTTYYWGYSTTDSSSNVTSISSTTSAYSSVSDLYTKTGTDATPASTTITFTGVKVGTTSVVIGGVKYNITVTAEDLSSVTAQTIHLYCSTFAVWAKGDSTKTSTVSISASDAYGKDGIDISTKVPAEGSWAYSSSEASTVFWKGVKLTYAYRQSATSNNDRSMSGVNYSKIRYYGGQWSVYDVDNLTWVNIASDDEVDAYYLQKTEVTNEVTTYVKDWAYTTSNCSSQSGESYQKALSFAVVYPDGQMSPATESDIYANSTLIYWQSTQNMFIRVGVNEVYEVEKLTYTAGERASSQSGNWSSSDSINWNKTTTADGSIWYDETTCWTPDDGTDPVINCSDIDAFSYSKGNYSGNDAILVLIYLKPVTTEDSLTVQYVDDSTNNEFLSYSVNVTNTSTEAKGTFLNRLQQTSAVQAGEFTLDDGAYVVNAKGTNETFQKDVTKIPSLMGTSYASGLYEYVKAELSTDGKTLTLHYNLKSDVESTDYVIDFGLGVTIPVSDLVTDTSGATVTPGDASYGTVTVSADGKTITYTPNTVLKSFDLFRVYFKYSDKTVSKTVKIIPATTVYYEEGFASGWTGGSVGSGTQTTSIAKSATASAAAVYGYDAKYASESAGASNGTQAVSTKVGDTATFTFTGTGVEVYMNSTTDSGSVMIVVKDSNDKLVEAAKVDTAMVNGSSDATDGQAVTGYNIPVYVKNGLARGTYTVTVTHIATIAKNTVPDAENTPVVKDVALDGFRVFGTIADVKAYEYDREENASFIELRDQVLAVQTADKSGVCNQVYGGNDPTVVVTSGTDASAAAAADLLENGPKNEIYLQPGDSVTFTINSQKTVEVGMKALNAAVTATATATGDGNTSGFTSLNITSSTDMFYTVKEATTNSNYTYTISNSSSSKGILAVTLVKICDDPDAALQVVTDVTDALVDLGLIDRPDYQPLPIIPNEDHDTDVTVDPDTDVTTNDDVDVNVNPDTDVTTNDDVDVNIGDIGDINIGSGDIDIDINFVFSDDGIGADWSWARDYIYAAYKLGLFKGDENGCFNPAKKLTRAEAVVVILALEGKTCEVNKDATVSGFSDADNAWYSGYVALAKELGITAGYDDGTFRPESTITREEFVTMVLAAKGIAADVTEGNFTDVVDTEWYAPYVYTAAANGITNGYPDGSFGVGCPVSRAEAAVMVVK